MKKIIISAILIALVIFLSSCSISKKEGYIEDDEKNTEVAINNFHEDLNNENYENIYNNLYEELQISWGKEKILTNMRQSHEELGNFINIKDKKMNVVIGAPVQVRAVYISSFEKGDVTEMFTYIKSGDAYKLALYKPVMGVTNLDNVN
ncbi:MAG: hypothetical protein ACM3UU_12110 [Ignavibacteriales bacterium]